VTIFAADHLAITIAGRTVVHDISFDIAAGRCVALVGASGSGKSQTCMAPFGLSPGRASGSVRLLGEELVGAGEKALRALRGRHVGFVFQQPLTALTPHLTIGAQLREAWMQAGAAAPTRAEMAAALDRVELDRPEERLRQYPHRLSGGQRQRALIAIAIAHRPKLLIADEPTTALDVTVQAEILDLLRDLRGRTGMSIIIVTHDLGVVADLCDRILIMSQGEIVEQGGTEDIFYSPAQDYTKKLISSTPNLVKAL